MKHDELANARRVNRQFLPQLFRRVKRVDEEQIGFRDGRNLDCVALLWPVVVFQDRPTPEPHQILSAAPARRDVVGVQLVRLSGEECRRRNTAPSPELSDVLALLGQFPELRQVLVDIAHLLAVSPVERLNIRSGLRMDGLLSRLWSRCPPSTGIRLEFRDRPRKQPVNLARNLRSPYRPELLQIKPEVQPADDVVPCLLTDSHMVEVFRTSPESVDAL